MSRLPEDRVPYRMREQQAERNRRARRLRDYAEGTAHEYRPRPSVTGPDPRYGAAVTVVRAPRPDVASPSIRVRFEDGEERSVRLSALHTPQPERSIWREPDPRPELSPAAQHARTFPAWQNLLGVLDTQHGLEALSVESRPVGAEAELRSDIQRRVSQLVTLVLPRDVGREERQAQFDDLMRVAEQEARERRAAQPGRAGRPRAAPVPLPRPAAAAPMTPEQLTRAEREMVNVIARCIHLRYFLSDKDPADSEDRAIRAAQKAGGLLPASRPSGRASPVHGQLQDANRAMYAAALEVCQCLTSGRDAQARALLERFKAARRDVLAAEAELQAQRPAIRTGRYFHGDILSVRQEHVVLDDLGNFAGYDGMTQFYTRLTVIHSGDGLHLDIANGPEIEARTSTLVGPHGWRDLCQWIQDQSDRAEGKRRGRRQDDDRHLIYREQDGALVLRDSIRRSYPGLVPALDAVRRALDPALSDVPDDEIPSDQPRRGYHPPQVQEKRDADA